MNDNSREPVAVGTVLGTFFPQGGSPIDESDQDQFRVSIDWQHLGRMAQFAEPHGTLAGLPYGYIAELLGRAAAAGEQLGLSLTAVRDSEVWRDKKLVPKQGNRRTIAGRALAEASGMWSISTGHAVSNVVARVIRVHRLSTHLDKAFGWNGRPAPFAQVPGSNLSLNSSTVKALARAASETGETPLVDLVRPLRDLVTSAAWVALVNRRDVGYHRWRPQSIDGGALTTNPWIDQGDGSMVLSVGPHSGHVPPTIESLAGESRAGHDALSSAMAGVLAVLPAAMKSAGVPIWQVDDIEESAT